MSSWTSWLRPKNGSRAGRRDELTSLLPTRNSLNGSSAISAKEVTKVAIRLKAQIEAVIPCELDESLITKAHSSVITTGVVKTAKSAGGNQYGACVVFALLVCRRWFHRQALVELWDAELHNVRAVACEVIAKHIIETEEDADYLQQEVLLKRYAIIVRGAETSPANAIEKAVDLHALHVIASSGYQKCISHLWKGWLVQDDDNVSCFIEYKDKTNPSYWAHFDPDRMRVPLYQNGLQILFSCLYLAFFTAAINTINPTGDIDIMEGLLYIFTVGFICDEVSKFWKIGRYYFAFWNAFNCTLYVLLTASFITRMIALTHPLNTHDRDRFNELSYNLLACGAPLFWGRMLLYLDTFKFFGTQLVVLKVMMQESLLFFTLLTIVCVGFLQAFLGLDQVGDNLTATSFILKSMIAAILQSPEFDGFGRFAPPFGLILYYIFTFTVLVLLLNILVALYNSAYSDITDNSDDEYLALTSMKTLGFVRAPDENVFIAPFNLIELIFLIIPFEAWMDPERYQRLNRIVMRFLYSPLLLLSSFYEVYQARKIHQNRARDADDDDVVEEWEQLGATVDLEGEGWTKTVESTKPNIATDAALLEIRTLRNEIEALRRALDSSGVSLRKQQPSSSEGDG